jgi:hypothetical protein
LSFELLVPKLSLGTLHYEKLLVLFIQVSGIVLAVLSFWCTGCEAELR